MECVRVQRTEDFDIYTLNIVSCGKWIYTNMLYKQHFEAHTYTCTCIRIIIIVTSNKQSSGHLIQNVGCTRRGCGSAGRGYGRAALEDGADAGTRLVLY